MHDHLHRREGDDDDAGQLGVAQHAGHHQPEGDGRQDHRQAETDHIAAESAMGAFFMMIVMMPMAMGVVGMDSVAHRRTPIR